MLGTWIRLLSSDELMSEEYISGDAEDSTTKIPPRAASIEVCQKDGDYGELSPSVHSEFLAVYKCETHLLRGGESEN